MRRLLPKAEHAAIAAAVGYVLHTAPALCWPRSFTQPDRHLNPLIAFATFAKIHPPDDCTYPKLTPNLPRAEPVRAATTARTAVTPA